MQFIITAILIASTACLALGQKRPEFTDEQLSQFSERDYSLQQKIVGTWFFESIGQNSVHASQRITYFENLTFVCDYRISSAGSVRFRRATGVWYCLMGWFCEVETNSSDDRGPSRMVRWVYDSEADLLKTESRTGVKATLSRGTNVPETFDQSVESLDEKELEKAFTERNMLGFVAEDTGKLSDDGSPLFRWILKSALLNNKDGQSGKKEKKTENKPAQTDGDKPSN